MAWVAFDRAVKAVEVYGLDGPVDAWRSTRDAIHAQVCAAAFNTARNAFVQHYDSTDLDADLLLIPLVGFLPPEDVRVRATIDAIQRAADGRQPGAALLNGHWRRQSAAGRRRISALHFLARRLPNCNRTA